MKPKLGFSIESLVGESPPPFSPTREESLSPADSLRSPSPIFSGSFFNAKSILDLNDKTQVIQRPQPINGAVAPHCRLLPEAITGILPPAVLQQVFKGGGGLPGAGGAHHPLVPPSHASLLPGLQQQGTGAAVPSQVNPLLMGGTGGIHSIANALPREYPLYPWLLSRHGRIFPQGLPSPEQLAYLLQPFRKPKRIRTAFSPSQLLKLEQAFEKNQYVVGGERKQLALSLNLSETQVKVWFQNRRTKEKRITQEGDSECEFAGERGSDGTTTLDESSANGDELSSTTRRRIDENAQGELHAKKDATNDLPQGDPRLPLAVGSNCQFPLATAATASAATRSHILSSDPTSEGGQLTPSEKSYGGKDALVEPTDGT